MAFYSHFVRDIQQILFRNREQHAIPSMDGALSPNGRLDRFVDMLPAIADVDDAVADGAALIVSAGRNVLRVEPGGRTQLLATFDAATGAVAKHPDGRVLVCISGRGLAAIAPDGSIAWLSEANDHPLHCLTSVAVAADGKIAISDGSDRHSSDDWQRDLMEKGKTGRIVICDADFGNARVVRDRLAYAHGCAFDTDSRYLWFTESWAHRVSRASWTAGDLGQTEIMIGNLPGYPARLTPVSDGGFWIALFALRTHLVELVLDDDEFRLEMMRTLEPSLWVSPQYYSGRSYLEPLQGGAMRKLGILKPWAPPRSYGFVGRIDSEGGFTETLQSRAGGEHHGIVRAFEAPEGLVVVSKAVGKLLQAPQEGLQ